MRNVNGLSAPLWEPGPGSPGHMARASCSVCLTPASWVDAAVDRTGTLAEAGWTWVGPVYSSRRTASMTPFCTMTKHSGSCASALHTRAASGCDRRRGGDDTW